MSFSFGLLLSLWDTTNTNKNTEGLSFQVPEVLPFWQQALLKYGITPGSFPRPSSTGEPSVTTGGIPSTIEEKKPKISMFTLKLFNADENGKYKVKYDSDGKVGGGLLNKAGAWGNEHEMSDGAKLAVIMASNMATNAYINHKGPIENSNFVNGISTSGHTVGRMLPGAAGVLTEAGTQVFDIVNTGLSTSTEKQTLDLNLVAQQGAAYSGTINDILDTYDETGKAIGGWDSIFGKKGRIEKNAKRAKMKEMAIGSINKNALDIWDRAEDPMLLLNYLTSMIGQPTYMVAKLGGRIKEITSPKVSCIIEKIEESLEVSECSVEIETFLKGGSINIIPEGALHARKNHMDIEGITPKGIPVISESEGGEIKLHAEIEHSEIIFRIEVTEKLEELAKENTDEAAIEAGKLLVLEILYNTEDRTGLLNEIDS